MIYILILSFIIICIFWIKIFLEDLEFTRNNFTNINFIGIFTFLILNISVYLILTVILGGFYWIILTSYHRNHPCDECRYIKYEKTYFDEQRNEITEFEYKWDHCKTLNWF